MVPSIWRTITHYHSIPLKATGGKVGLKLCKSPELNFTSEISGRFSTFCNLSQFHWWHLCGLCFFLFSSLPHYCILSVEKSFPISVCHAVCNLGNTKRLYYITILPCRLTDGLIGISVDLPKKCSLLLPFCSQSTSWVHRQEQRLDVSLCSGQDY